MIGRELSRFEITAKLGEGGMGEVWRARDSRLGREVAIKVLPEAVAEDPERLARFEREAQVLASLNHPNIAGIHEVGESPGEPEIHFLVMELVEGPTLAERLEQGPLPLSEAIPVALQIVEALEAAHEKGIVHRDLKPQNIKLTPEGGVKVLDFGLAKAMGPEESASGSSPQLTHSPTMTLGATMEGVILGTAAYMAPEQAKGQAADKRADIWAFGVVVKEMLTGKRLFDAPTAPETLAKVLTSTPAIAELPSSTPPALRRLLGRCLVREPRQRLRDIGDARLELETARTETEAGASEGAAVVASSAWKRWREVAAWALAAIGIAVAIVGLASRGDRDAGRDAVRFDLNLPEGHRLAYGDEQLLAFSRDGRMLAFVAIASDRAEQMIFVRPLDELEARPVPGTEGATNPVFSPDGQQLAFFAHHELRRIPVEGGRAIRLAEAPNPRGVDWSPDGSLLYSPDYDAGLWRVPAGFGSPEIVLETREDRDERTFRWPDVSSDGRAVLFTIGFTRSPNDYEDAEIAVQRLDTGEVEVLIEKASTARFTASDRILFGRDGQLFSVGVDLDSLSLVGEPRPVVDGVAGDPSSGVIYFDVGGNGELAHVPGSFAGTQSHLAVVDLQGGETGSEALGPQGYNPRFSPDGKGLVFTVGAQASNTGAIWSYSLADGVLHRVSFGDGYDGSPVYSPDGRWIVFVRGDEGIVRKPADGSGSPELLTPADEAGRLRLPNSFTPDGETLAFTELGSTMDVYLMHLGDKPVFFERDAASPAISPDGRWIAFQTPAGSGSSVVVRPLLGEGRWQVSPQNGSYPWWSKDGKELYYIDIGQASRPLVKVPILAGESFRFGSPQIVLEDVAYRFVTATSPDTNWQISPSADRAVFVAPERDEADRDRIEIRLGSDATLRGNE